MKYPFGRCRRCGKPFNLEQRKKYHVKYCPWCGEEIDDYLTAENIINPDRRKDIYCEECGRRIYERDGPGGYWIDEDAGVCSGPCERELCGRCADWKDGVDGGECRRCREEAG
jgi:DNA-directed RNA polymerase subunit RPC12/RpoP